MGWYVLIGIIAYLVGSINLSIILCKKLKGEDIRNMGSGNAGTTNTLRTLGKGYAVLVLLFDILKGTGIVLLANMFNWIPDKLMLVQLVGILVILGHIFPIYYGFKGGKGVATALGVIFAIDWKIGIICFIFGLLIIAITRYVSLASVTAAILYPVVMLVLRGGNYLIFSVIIAAIILIKHRANIQRLFSGTENKISFKK